MKNRIFKALYICAALVFFTGAFIFCCAFFSTLPKGTFVNGVDVGGLTRTAAKKLLREGVIGELKEKRLRICIGEEVYSYSYPEIDFTDGFEDTLARIGRRGSYFAPVTYFMNGLDEVCGGICESHFICVEEPRAEFNLSGEPFTYYEGRDGLECDLKMLKKDVAASLNSDFKDVYVCTRAVMRSRTLEDVKNETVKLAAFTTYFDGSNADRTANIRLAAEKINGCAVGAGEEFSFNKTVGERSAEKGFKRAKIIENGRFVLGFGGGVCQTSTTLYNAAILSGLAVTEYHPHSLQVGYVAPSRDAMVSGDYYDLKFVNTRKTPIYIRVNCTMESITCAFYGESDGLAYSFISRTEEVLPRPEPVIVEGAEDRVLSYGREGVVSEGYLAVSDDSGTREVLLRRDRYPAVADVIQTKRSDGE